MPFTVGCRPIWGFPHFDSSRKGLHPPSLHDLERDKDGPPGQPYRKPNPERDRVTKTALQKADMRTASTASAKAQSRKGQSHRKPTCIAFCHHNPLLDSLIESPWLLPAPARTALQKAHMRTRQHCLAESPTEKATNSQKGFTQSCFQSCLGPVESSGPRRLCRRPR